MNSISFFLWFSPLAHWEEGVSKCLCSTEVPARLNFSRTVVITRLRSWCEKLNYNCTQHIEVKKRLKGSSSTITPSCTTGTENRVSQSALLNHSSFSFFFFPYNILCQNQPAFSPLIFSSFYSLGVTTAFKASTCSAQLFGFSLIHFDLFQVALS